MMSDEVWVLGATGRTARAICGALDRAAVKLVLVGRDQRTLEEASRVLTGTPRVMTASLDSLGGALASDAPAVVVNTIGPFASSALRVIDALPPGTHYVDIANELVALQRVLARDPAAVRDGSAIVTGAGFGVVATESVVRRLCEERASPVRVRVDALPSLAMPSGKMGSALAGTIVESLPTGRRQVRAGRLVRTPFDDTRAPWRTPEGDELVTANFSSGDLLAAWRASGAQEVVAASSEIPTGQLAHVVLPAVSLLARSRGARSDDLSAGTRQVGRPRSTAQLLMGSRPARVGRRKHAGGMAASRRCHGLHR